MVRTKMSARFHTPQEKHEVYQRVLNYMNTEVDEVQKDTQVNEQKEIKNKNDEVENLRKEVENLRKEVENLREKLKKFESNQTKDM